MCIITIIINYTYSIGRSYKRISSCYTQGLELSPILLKYRLYSSKARLPCMILHRIWITCTFSILSQYELQGIKIWHEVLQNENKKILMCDNVTYLWLDCMYVERITYLKPCICFSNTLSSMLWFRDCNWCL